MTQDIVKNLSSTDIVAQYLAFFRQHQHVELPGSSVVVPGSNTSFIIAGMQPLLPYLSGQETPPASRLTALQRCLRTDDADVVGSNASKLTCFHMLGNWSIDDYGKGETMAMALELLDIFGVDRERLWVTTFAGDVSLGIGPDEYTVSEWQRLGIPPERIVPLGVEDNLWPSSTTGGIGVCGPCTEMFVDRGIELGCGKSTCRPGCDCDRFLEFWNLVFIEYEQQADGSVAKMPFLSIDTGMGLERIAAILQDVRTVFDVDLFAPASVRLMELASSSGEQDNVARERARRMIVDHTRAALFAMLASIAPGRDGRNSVVRRLIRRAARQGRLLGIDEPFLGQLVSPLAQMHNALLTPEERRQIPAMITLFTEEEERFTRVLTIGLRELTQLEPDERGVVSGERVFELHAEKGFPSDLAAEVLSERGLTIDWESYRRVEEEHRDVSRRSVQSHFSSN
jgi:alanyl-tRNA synthetase